MRQHKLNVKHAIVQVIELLIQLQTNVLVIFHILMKEILYACVATTNGF